LSGKPIAANRKLLHLLLGNEYTPVIAPPIIDERNVAINTENDDVVAMLSEALRPRWIIQLIEAPGLLRDPSDPLSAVPFIPRGDVERWEDRVEGRMKRKMLAIKRLVGLRSTTVTITDGRRESPISDAIAGRGTVIA